MRTGLEERNDLFGTIEGVVIPRKAQLISPAGLRQEQTVDGFVVLAAKSLVQGVYPFGSNVMDICLGWGIRFGIRRRDQMT